MMPNDEAFNFAESIEMVYVDAQVKRLDKLIVRERGNIWILENLKLQDCRRMLRNLKGIKGEYIRQQLDKLVGNESPSRSEHCA